MSSRTSNAAPMERLPFADLPEPVLPEDDAPDLSPYTAPTWARSTPRNRLVPVLWPPNDPPLLADRVFDELTEQLEVDERITKTVAGWLKRAEQRIAQAVRPHLGDVHVARCGSFASGTHLRTGFDVDIVVRTFAFEGTPSPANGGNALEDLARWLNAGLEVPTAVRGGAVRVDAPGGVVLRVLPWRTDGENSSDTEHRRCSVDPLAHAQLIAARDAHLAKSGCFSRLIRIVKHLARQRDESGSQMPLSSFAIDTLALNICTAPFSLPEGMTHFLQASAELVRRPLTHPLAANDPIHLANAEGVAQRLSRAADVCEAALFAVEPTGLAELARLLRIDDLASAAPQPSPPAETAALKSQVAPRRYHALEQTDNERIRQTR